MTGCCILGCNNRSEEGYYMKRFPVDPTMKRIWLENIGRKNWEPKQYSAVCEVHFSKEMWEKTRQDGKKKLKIQAVPTILLEYPVKHPEATSPTSNITVANIDESLVPILPEHLNEHPEVTSPTSNISSLEYALAEIKTLKQKLQNKDAEVNNLQERLEKANKILCTVDRSNKTLVKRIKRLSMKRIRIEKSVLQSKELLKTGFNNDQIQWLQLQSQSSKRCVSSWSKETIKKALQIKFSCTNSGYNELIKQKIPLPSTRSLRQSLEGIDFTPGILNNIFNAMKNKVQQFEDQRQLTGTLLRLQLTRMREKPGPTNNTARRQRPEALAEALDRKAGTPASFRSQRAELALSRVQVSQNASG
ncbi:PREDICTED: uncharacterized protein LOC105450905 [Wasmannia auropunctata]|uniref:uncharacterized protein LOC105450905 n=1 Tax=Wasmannia auropunctata TaxID=64793 RepID=UPI0005EF6099|nr:PREDICTED: uncharacterized protein LOC105450905 [Wasmannia auropunctata]